MLLAEELFICVVLALWSMGKQYALLAGTKVGTLVVSLVEGP